MSERQGLRVELAGVFPLEHARKRSVAFAPGPSPGQTSPGEADRTGSCHVEIAPLSKSEPAAMDPGFQALIETAAERHAPGKHMRMPSGAGHDAQWLARKLPAAMMFVPSIGGISHHWSENTSDEDLVLGAQVFTDGIAETLKG